MNGREWMCGILLACNEYIYYPAIETNGNNLTLSDHAESESLKEVVSIERGMVSSRTEELI